MGNSKCVKCAQAIPGKHPCQICDTCKGSRSVWRDAYTNQIVQRVEEDRVTVGGRSKRRKGIGNDRCIADVVHELHKHLRAEGLGSLADLDKCMSRLRREDEAAYYPVKRFYAGGWAPSEGESWAIARGLVSLEQWMPREIRVPAFIYALEHGTGEAARLSGKSRSKIRRLRAA